MYVFFVMLAHFISVLLISGNLQAAGISRPSFISKLLGDYDENINKEELSEEDIAALGGMVFLGKIEFRTFVPVLIWCSELSWWRDSKLVHLPRSYVPTEVALHPDRIISVYLLPLHGALSRGR